jgi:hypothetical protein
MPATARRLCVAFEEELREKEDVAAARPKRWDVHPNDVDSVEEIFAETLFFDFGLQVAVRGRDDAGVERDFLVAADGAGSPLLQGTEKLGLHAGGHLADLVEQNGAARGFDEEAGTRVARVGEGAFDVPEELAFEEVLRHRGAVDGHEGPVLARALRVQRPRDEFLARAALAGDEDRRLGVGDARDELAHLQHRLARAEDVFEALRSLDRLSQAFDLFAQRAVIEGALDRQGELVHVERLRHEVVRAGTNGGDGRLHVRERGDDDDGHVLAARDEELAELDAAHPRHVHVGHHDAEVVSLEAGDRVLGRVDRGDVVVPPAELHLEDLAHASVVVDDEDAAFHEILESAPTLRPGDPPRQPGARPMPEPT